MEVYNRHEKLYILEGCRWQKKLIDTLQGKKGEKNKYLLSQILQLNTESIC